MEVPTGPRKRQLWSLIRDRFPQLRTLSLEANFIDIPCPGGVPKKLEFLQLRWSKRLIDDLRSHEMLLADKIELVFPRIREAPRPENNCFTTPQKLAQHLKKLAVKMTHCEIPGRGPLFDVVPIPQADIHIEIRFDVHYTAHIPPAWRKIKPGVSRLVKPDLASFDVSRAKEEYIFIDRPSLIEHPDFKPTKQAHLCSEEDDALEQRAMEAYCALSNPLLWLRAG
ncbi:hypothetical protein AURDEDRAFT_175008 [Auricularia subglabra TFB-10046 SS5]|nr:hypothetical protein AURDEDRAFT_175008 [Auricularia subglabra TFB-10046 SS5]